MATLFDVFEGVLRDRSKYSPDVEKLMARLREAFDERAELDPRAVLIDAIAKARAEGYRQASEFHTERARREGYEAGLAAGRAETITTAGGNPFGLGPEERGRGDDWWRRGYGVPSGSRVYKPGELEAELAASAKYDAKLAAERRRWTGKWAKKVGGVE